MKRIYLKINQVNYNHIKYGFFTRIGGYSKKNYSSLNCSFSSGDNPQLVKQNIQSAMGDLKLKNKKLKCPKQIHSNFIAEINKNNLNKEIEADGLITNDTSIALGILTADCTPILIFDKSKSFICCLHAGWKGTLLNIVKSSFNQISKYNKKLDEIIVLIGPCLGNENFEISLDFKDEFIQVDSNYNEFFTKKKDDKEYFDMRGLINFQFKKLGVKNIFNLNQDTYYNYQLFYSHRRDKHNNKLNTGRMINIISFQ